MNLVAELARLHSLDYAAAGLGDLGRPEGYVERQVTGWTRRWTATRRPTTSPRWTGPPNGSWPTGRAESAPAIIHNDYKFDNLLLDPDDLTRIVAVLDWEMATLGDPLMDLGTTLGYWIEAGDPEPLRQNAMGPTAHPRKPDRRELVERYEETERPAASPTRSIITFSASSRSPSSPADLRPICQRSDPRPPLRGADPGRDGSSGGSRCALDRGRIHGLTH